MNLLVISKLKMVSFSTNGVVTGNTNSLPIDSIPYGHGIGNAVSLYSTICVLFLVFTLRTCNSVIFFTNFTKLLLINQYV